jgi:transposase-like protein
VRLAPSCSAMVRLLIPSLRSCLMEERGFSVHYTTIYRWIQTYARQLEKLIRW